MPPSPLPDPDAMLDGLFHELVEAPGTSRQPKPPATRDWAPKLPALVRAVDRDIAPRANALGVDLDDREAPPAPIVHSAPDPIDEAAAWLEKAPHGHREIIIRRGGMDARFSAAAFHHTGLDDHEPLVARAKADDVELALISLGDMLSEESVAAEVAARTSGANGLESRESAEAQEGSGESASPKAIPQKEGVFGTNVPI